MLSLLAGKALELLQPTYAKSRYCSCSLARSRCLTTLSLLAGKALELLQQAQQAAPTLIELHSVQARFLKHGGCLRGAAKAAVHAESLDMADRQASQPVTWVNICPVWTGDKRQSKLGFGCGVSEVLMASVSRQVCGGCDQGRAQ